MKSCLWSSQQQAAPAHLCILLLLFFGLPGDSHASTVFSNIAGNCCGGNGVDGSNGAESLGEAFVSPFQAILQSAQVEVFAVQGFGGDPSFNMSLFSDSAGIPGGLIATLGTNLQAPVGGGLVTASGGNPLLLAGTEYWLVLSPYDSSTQVGWEQGGSSTVPFAFTPSTTGMGGWRAQGTNTLQFAINGTPTATVTPEPSSIVLLSSGVVSLLGILRRRKRT